MNFFTERYHSQNMAHPFTFSLLFRPQKFQHGAYWLDMCSYAPTASSFYCRVQAFFILLDVLATSRHRCQGIHSALLYFIL